MVRGEVWYEPEQYPNQQRVVVEAFRLLLSELRDQDAFDNDLMSDIESIESERSMRHYLNTNQPQSRSAKRRVDETPEDSVERLKMSHTHLAGRRERYMTEVRELYHRFANDQHHELDPAVYFELAEVFRDRALNAAGELLYLTPQILEAPAYAVVDDNKHMRACIARMRVYLNACIALTGLELGTLISSPFEKVDQETPQ